MAPSSCFKMMKALIAQDFASMDEHSKRYSLGSGAIAVAHRALDDAGYFAPDVTTVGRGEHGAR